MRKKDKCERNLQIANIEQHYNSLVTFELGRFKSAEEPQKGAATGEKRVTKLL
jgi:hypothetical protein